MKYHGIMFKDEMVKAILSGGKTQTRRICKGARELSCAKDWPIESCPYGQVGDRLWVKETFLDGYGIGGCVDGDLDNPINVIYRADEDVHGIVWKPSIFMPRRASRITLEITGIKVERVQDISTFDALAEGVAGSPPPAGDWRDLYGILWDSINGKEHPWASNPWVWVITFKRIKEEQQATLIAK